MIVIAVECDKCHRRVAAEKNGQYCIALMRARLAKNGWKSPEHSGKDFCPSCAKPESKIA